jgi:multisubunit Na+/H+ antiporter MnhF subunit
VNAWLTVAVLLMVAGLVPCAAVAGRGDALRRLIGANLLSVVLVGVLLLLAQGLGRSAYVDVGLVLAVLAPAGTLVFTRLLAPDDGGGEPEDKEPHDGEPQHGDEPQHHEDQHHDDQHHDDRHHEDRDHEDRDHEDRDHEPEERKESHDAPS